MREALAAPIIRSYISMVYVVVANLDYVGVAFFIHLKLQPDETNNLNYRNKLGSRIRKSRNILFMDYYV